MKKFLIAVIFTFSVCNLCFAAPFLNADDFIPIIQAPEEQREELSTVQHPEDIDKEFFDPETNTKITKGRTVQDEINSIIGDPEMEGSGHFYTSEGTGYVATGSASYNKSLKNITALRMSRQSAYIRAFNIAIGNLVSTKQETSVEGEDSSTENRNSLVDGNRENPSTNMSRSSSSRRGVSVAGVLSGYVTYRVYDDFEHGQVFVTLVSTPKTRGEFRRSANPNLLGAKTLNDGLNVVLAEIQSGFVPPLGGRTVEVPSTGEIAFIGFGSSVIVQSKTQTILNNNRRVARSIARLYADDALCGIITGNKVQMLENTSRNEQEIINEYEKIQGENPASQFLPYEEAQTNFFTTEEFSQTVSSARKGVLPPGITRRAWIDKAGEVAYAISVYIPSLSDAAAGAKGMTQNKLVKPLKPEENMQHTEKFIKNQQELEKFKQDNSGVIEQAL